MKNKGLTTSERRGIIGLLVIAWLLIGSGWLVRSCNHSRHATEITAETESGAATAEETTTDRETGDSIKAKKKATRSKRSSTLQKSPRAHKEEAASRDHLRESLNQ